MKNKVETELNVNRTDRSTVPVRKSINFVKHVETYEGGEDVGGGGDGDKFKAE